MSSYRKDQIPYGRKRDHKKRQYPAYEDESTKAGGPSSKDVQGTSNATTTGFQWSPPQPSANKIGQPKYAISANQKKKTFCTLNDASGELSLVHNWVIHTESPELEHLQYLSTDKTSKIDGWTGWHNYELQSLQSSNAFRLHLDYSISSGGQVYAIKKAILYDSLTQKWYDYSLSNLVGLTLRYHRVTGSTLKHIIFDNVTNKEAWQAMKTALNCLEVTLPLHPGGLTTNSKGARIPEVCARINSLDHSSAWKELHSNNPFTRMLEYLMRDERIQGLGFPVAYTIAAVPKVRLNSYERQGYWSALIAHF